MTESKKKPQGTRLGGKNISGKRAALSGKRGGKCWKIVCQKDNALWLNVNNLKYYCKKCAELLNFKAKSNGKQPACVEYECENKECNFYNTKYELSCCAWGLIDVRPIDCLNRQRKMMGLFVPDNWKDK